MSPQTVPAGRMTAAAWRIVLLASLGGTIEFYDFVIFGIFARDIAEAIFPSTSLLVSLMASFAAFAAGYLVRPLGGIVLSHYGDRYGRRRVFLWSLFAAETEALNDSQQHHQHARGRPDARMVRHESHPERRARHDEHGPEEY